MLDQQFGLPDTGEAAPASIAQPAPAVAPLGTNASGNNEVPTMFGMDAPTYTKTMLSVFQDPQKLIQIGELAVKHQQPQWLDWLKRGHDVQRENAGNAVMKLLGGDTQGALEAFNSSGQHRASAITPAGDGAYDIAATGADGQTYTRRIDPKKEMLTFLTPPQYIAHTDREAALDVKSSQLDTQSKALDVRAGQMAAETARKSDADKVREGYLNDKIANAQRLLELQAQGIDVKKELAQAQIDLTQARAGLADARAGAVDGGTPTKRNWNSINNGIYTEAKTTDYVKRTSKTDPTKTEVDGAKLNILTSMAQNLARSNPDLADVPGKAVYTAIQKLGEIDDMVKSRVDDEAKKVAAGEPGLLDKGNVKDYYAKDGAKNLDDWKQKRAERLRREALSGAGLSTTEAPASAKSPTAVSGTIRGATPATDGAPATPKTMDELAALPSGSLFVNPADGKVLRKK